MISEKKEKKGIKEEIMQLRTPIDETVENL